MIAGEAQGKSATQRWSVLTRSTSWWVTALLVAGVLGFLLVQLSAIREFIWNNATELPFNDAWQMIPLFERRDAGTLRIEHWWRPQGGIHRILIPKLQTFLLIELTGWHARTMLLFMVGMVVVTGLLLLDAVRVTFNSYRIALITAVPIFFILLSFGRYHNWLKPFSDKIPTALGVAICVWALAAARPGRWRLAVAIFGALFASLSSFGGLAVWIAFFPAVFFASRFASILWVVVAVGFLGIYARGLGGGENADTSIMWSVIDTPAFALAYLGGPLSIGQFRIGVVAGAVSLLLCLFNIAVYWRLKDNTRPDSSLTWIGLALFVLGAGGITALGRSELLNSAVSSRYQGISVLWWVAVIVLACLATQRVVHWTRDRAAGSPGTGRTRGNWLMPVFLVINVVVLSIGAVAAINTSRNGIRLGEKFLADHRANEECIRDYETAPSECFAIYGVEERVRSGVVYLAEHRMSIFREEPAD